MMIFYFLREQSKLKQDKNNLFLKSELSYCCLQN